MTNLSMRNNWQAIQDQKKHDQFRLVIWDVSTFIFLVAFFGAVVWRLI